jgi:hypothetical protein
MGGEKAVHHLRNNNEGDEYGQFYYGAQKGADFILTQTKVHREKDRDDAHEEGIENRDGESEREVLSIEFPGLDIIRESYAAAVPAFHEALKHR